MPTDLPRRAEPSAWADRPVAAARAGIVVVLVLAPVAAVVGGLVDGGEGVKAALQGACIPGAVLLLTALAAEVRARRSAQAFAGLLLGSYLVKLVAVLVVLYLVRDVEGTSRTVLGLTAVLGLMAALVVEARVITSTRAPYVEP